MEKIFGDNDRNGLMIRMSLCSPPTLIFVCINILSMYLYIYYIQWCSDKASILNIYRKLNIHDDAGNFFHFAVCCCCSCPISIAILFSVGLDFYYANTISSFRLVVAAT